MTMFNSKNYKLTLAILVLLIITAFSLKILIGNVFYYQGQRLVQEAKQNRDEGQQQATIAEAIKLLDNAIAFDEQADYLELKASLLVWQSRKQTPADPRTINEALTLYQEALYMRPSWPYAWLGIVEAKLAAKQFDADLEKAIERTITLGFYEAMVQKQLLQFTLPVYRKLSADNRRAIFSMYQQALKANNHSALMIRLGNEASIFPLFCILEKNNLDSFSKTIINGCERILGNKKGS